MKGNSNIVQGFHHLKRAHMHFDSVFMDNPESRGRGLFRFATKRIENVVKEFTCNISMPDEVRCGIRDEWNSDVFLTDDLYDNICLLNPRQREAMEVFLDALVSGEEDIVFETNEFIETANKLEVLPPAILQHVKGIINTYYETYKKKGE